MFAQPGKIGHCLRRVVDIALQVNEGRALRQYALLESVVQRVADFAHVGIAGAKIHVVANTDNVGTK